MKRYFAGIGSRLAPKEIISVFKMFSKKLIELDFVLRSGGADGADLFWENCYDLYHGSKEIYLPYKNFNKSNSSFHNISDEAKVLAKKYHPVWNNLSDSNKLFHARNVYQVLGFSLTDPCDMVICWTPEGRTDGKEIGGTSQAIRIANDYNIPVFNLQNSSDINRLNTFIELNYSLWQNHQTATG